MKRLFLIKRKAYNFYTDYTRLYLHRAFETKNYYLILDESKCLFDIFIYISDEKYMTAYSSYFDAFSDEEADEFAKILSENFKSEVIVEPYTSEYEFKGAKYRFMFSNRYNAFLEDPYVYDLPPKFLRRTCSARCEYNNVYLVEYINFGGAFNGIKIKIAFENETVELEDTFLLQDIGKQYSKREIFFQKHNGIFECVIDDFALERGINEYSAKLKGKTGFRELSKHGFTISFVPKGAEGVLSPKISVSAL